MQKPLALWVDWDVVGLLVLSVASRVSSHGEDCSATHGWVTWANDLPSNSVFFYFKWILIVHQGGEKSISFMGLWGGFPE